MDIYTMQLLCHSIAESYPIIIIQINIQPTQVTFATDTIYKGHGVD